MMYERERRERGLKHLSRRAKTLGYTMTMPQTRTMRLVGGIPKNSP
jgi:hypothetical protein